MASDIHATHAIQQADAILADHNAPTYSEAMQTLLELAKAAGPARGVDTHVVFKAWRLLDRWSSMTRPPSAPPFPPLDDY